MHILPNISVTDKIQAGGSGEVYSGVLKGTSKEVAVKVVPFPNSTAKARYIEEATLTQSLSGKHVVIVNQIVVKENKIIMVMEKMDTDLFEVLERPLPQKQIKTIFYKICQAVQYCHRNKVAHLDIKPENILLDAKYNTVKLCDFGHAHKFNPKEKLNTTSTLGTEFYIAPEIAHRQPFYADRADLWSLGILLSVMINGNYPYAGDGEVQKNNFYEGKIDLSETHKSRFDVACKYLIKRLLTADPNQRPTIEEVLNSPWFDDIRENDTKQRQQKHHLLGMTI